ncbi:MAG: DMT family transporter [Beijerinckiaceae bacterium]
MQRGPGAGGAMNASEWAMLVFLSLLWGSSFFFASVALRELGTITVVLLRVGLAALPLVALALLLRALPPFTLKAAGEFLVMASLNIVAPFLLIVWGQTQISSGLASILNATTPLFTVVVAHVWGDERLTRLRLAGVFVGFCGVVALVGPAALGRSEASLAAHLAGVLAAFCYACASVYSRRFVRQGVAPMASAAATTSAGGLLLLPLAFAFEQPLDVLHASPAVLGAVAGLALLSTTLGYILYYRILARSGSTNLMLVTFLMPVTAILLGALALGESLRPGHALGMALIAFGLALIDGRAFARLRR